VIAEPEGEALNMIVKNHTGTTMGLQVGKGWVTLLPGVNRIAKEDWEAFIRNPARRHQLAEGELEVVEEEELLTLKAKSPKDAIALVKNTVRKDLLETWFADENRKTILEAIEKQLAAIAPPPAKRDDDEGADGAADDMEGDDAET
jgi:hypothetical protein